MGAVGGVHVCSPEIVLLHPLVPGRVLLRFNRFFCSRFRGWVPCPSGILGSAVLCIFAVLCNVLSGVVGLRDALHCRAQVIVDQQVLCSSVKNVLGTFCRACCSGVVGCV